MSPNKNIQIFRDVSNVNSQLSRVLCRVSTTLKRSYVYVKPHRSLIVTGDLDCRSASATACDLL